MNYPNKGGENLYKVGINIQIDKIKGIRYVQAGIEKEGRFTGRVIDYAGGGVFETFYWLNGREITDRENYKEIEEKINRNYPGLMGKIYRLEDKYIDYNSCGWPVPKKKLVEALKKGRPGYLFSTGAHLNPVTCSCGLTIFPDSRQKEA